MTRRQYNLFVQAHDELVRLSKATPDPCCDSETLSTAADALEARTVFPSLVKPFMMGKGGAADGREALEVFGFNGKG